jgi:hypothetical protein
MTDVAAIHALPATVPAAPAGARSADPATMRVEFDALMLEMIIKSSGLLDALDSSDSGSAMMGEMMAYPLARQLAEQMDLGFGSMVLRANETTTVKGG